MRSYSLLIRRTANEKEHDGARNGRGGAKSDSGGAGMQLCGVDAAEGAAQDDVEGGLVFGVLSFVQLAGEAVGFQLK